MYIPSLLMRQLYTFGSLRNVDPGVEFVVRNRLSDAELTGVRSLRMDGQEVPLDRVRIDLPDGGSCEVDAVSAATPLFFPLKHSLRVQVRGARLEAGHHHLEVVFLCRPFGTLELRVDDTVSDLEREASPRIPRDAHEDYGEGIIRSRQEYVERVTGTTLRHVRSYSFDPHLAVGNCEHFTGAAQVPLGVAGPLRIDGEHAQGEFLVPLATSEGTLVASYNRGMHLLNQCGGAKCTVVADAMQRAPAFVFADARAARDFLVWLAESESEVRQVAESTSHVARLESIDPYTVGKLVYLRFNYTTGDAAGQNMVSKATFAACAWISDHHPGIERFYLESNFATDKKASQVNSLRTRGKRVTAEAVIPRELLLQRLRVEPETLVHHYQVANVGAFLAGANNNGLHAANALAAIFIATGQDVANVAESSAGIVFTELTRERDLYISITLPSLIVATYGGGTGLATQRECLEMMGCFGKGKVRKLAEIVAGAVLAGELSLAAAISAAEWVSSHERLGRNR